MMRSQAIHDYRTQYASPIRFKQGEVRAEALRDYSAQELDVDAGDDLLLHHEPGGWWWSEHADGRVGWVPATHLEPI